MSKFISKHFGRGGGTPFIGLYGDAPPIRGTVFRFHLYKRVGTSQVEVCKREANLPFKSNVNMN